LTSWIFRFCCIYSTPGTRHGENYGYQKEGKQKSFEAENRQEAQSDEEEGGAEASSRSEEKICEEEDQNEINQTQGEKESQKEGKEKSQA
jgi:hypothetical protein